MWKPTFSASAAPDFWAPKPSRLWSLALDPVRRHYLHNVYGVDEIKIDGAERLSAISAQDGCLFAPNHSHDSDPHVMMHVGRELDRTFYFMAAWQIFQAHKGIDGWVMQRMGAYSVDREGCDRRAMRQTVDLLKTGQCVVVFPEGEVYHTNEKLNALRDGVAFMAVNAQKDLAQSSQRVWVVPTAIRYKYVEDITPKLAEAAGKMEQRLMLSARPEMPLDQRIIRLGEVLLTIKEKEQLGKSQESLGDLPTRLKSMIAALLERLEVRLLKKAAPEESVPLRVKQLRRHLIEICTDEKSNAAARQEAQAALEEVQLAMQLYSYPGDYVASKPTVERMAETIEKFEEDLDGTAYPKGKRRARVVLGEPIDVKATLAAGRPRTAAADLTAKMEREIKKLMETDA